MDLSPPDVSYTPCHTLKDLLYVLYTMVRLFFFLGPAGINGRLFIHSGVKLLLYLADDRERMHSLCTYFLFLCTSSAYRAVCSGFIEATLVITKDLWMCWCPGMSAGLETWQQTAVCSSGSVMRLRAPRCHPGSFSSLPKGGRDSGSLSPTVTVIEVVI